MKIWMFLLVLLCIPSVIAIEGSVKLLAVSETEEETYGSVADLSLEIREGRGRVFLETYPLTKIDTQISMRFAQQIACNHLDMDCRGLDFIYTIKAPAGIIGGPSAGASAAVLTTLLLSRQMHDGDIAVTGTINSGGLIGGVGGIREKITAAAKANISTVLIPHGKRFLDENGTKTDLVAYGEELGIHVKEVTILDEVLSYYLGEEFTREEISFEVSPEYQNIMRYVSHELCSRSDQFKEPTGELDELFVNLLNDSLGYRSLAQDLFANEQFYSAASYCFRTNINYGYISLYLQELSEEEIRDRLKKIEKGVAEFNSRLDERELETINDLQTYMIVKERLVDTIEQVDRAYKETNSSEVAYFLSLANERLYSATAWANFFRSPGQPVALDVGALRSSCETKIREAEERLQYVLLFIPNALDSVRRGIEKAQKDLEKGDYELCLFKASKAKAESNVVISAIGTDKEFLVDIFREKLVVVQDTIAKSSAKNIFPIVGYSYFEYAKTLEEQDINLALLFVEYALELSSLELYFSEPEGMQIEKGGVILFAVLVILVILAYLFRPRVKKAKPRKKSKRKK